MSNKRKSSSVGFSYNANDFKLRSEAKGSKPLPNPISVCGALVNAIVFVCRKFMFFNTNLRIIAFMVLLFSSIIFDQLRDNTSRLIFFSQSSNVFNQWFVKWGWAWTLVLTVPFVLLTSKIYCCGEQRKVQGHLSRLFIATVVWWIVTKSFVYLENNTGACSSEGEKFTNKKACLQAGHFWQSIDISGHAFILIYSTLIIIEETRTITSWESISDLIRDEKYFRSTAKASLSRPLKHLTDNELQYLSTSFIKYSLYIRFLFIGLTLLTLLWHVMVVTTVIYFHKVHEKLLGGGIAIVMWYFTYKYWYSKVNLPPAPGKGLFQYSKHKSDNGTSVKNTSTGPKSRIDIGPTFMGMPLYANKVEDSEAEKHGPNLNLRNGPVTRSQARMEATS